MTSAPLVQKPPVVPPASNPTPRTKDWIRTGEPGSAFSGLSTRGGRGSSSRGSGRGGSRPGRGRGGFRGGRGTSVDAQAVQPTPGPATATTPAVAKPAPPPPATPKITPKATTATPSIAPAPTLPTTVTPTVAAGKGPETSSRTKNSRRTSRSTPSVVIDTAVETSTSPTSARTPNRRRRGQSNKTPVITPASPKPPTVHTALDESALRPQKSRIKPALSSAPVVARDAPPHLDMRKDIDALVERVRASAMADDRPTTPGSHIDWAGDDDDSLPDLDDWGVKPLVNTLISPIMVDGLKSLPEPVINPPTPEPAETPKLNGWKSSPLKHSIQVSSGPPKAKEPLHSSLPQKPSAVIVNHQRSPSPSRSPKVVTPATAPVQNVDSVDDVVSAAALLSAPTFSSFLPGRPFQGLEASIHAPHAPLSQTHSAPSDINAFTTPPRFTPSHGRSHTVGRQANDNGYSPRFSRSGNSTPRGGLHANDLHHHRTHSSPPTGGFSNHRVPHSRPVITGDAMSRLMKTIGGSPSKSAAPTLTKD